MRGVNTEPLYRSVRVTLGHCLLLEDKKFLRSQASQPKKITPSYVVTAPPLLPTAFLMLFTLGYKLASHTSLQYKFTPWSIQPVTFLVSSRQAFFCVIKKHGNARNSQVLSERSDMPSPALERKKFI
jgi:hypothetical protein